VDVYADFSIAVARKVYPSRDSGRHEISTWQRASRKECPSRLGITAGPTRDYATSARSSDFLSSHKSPIDRRKPPAICRSLNLVLCAQVRSFGAYWDEEGEFKSPSVGHPWTILGDVLSSLTNSRDSENERDHPACPQQPDLPAQGRAQRFAQKPNPRREGTEDRRTEEVLAHASSLGPKAWRSK